MVSELNNKVYSRRTIGLVSREHTSSPLWELVVKKWLPEGRTSSYPTGVR